MVSETEALLKEMERLRDSSKAAYERLLEIVKEKEGSSE